MKLVDRVAQARTPFIAVCASSGAQTHLSGASDCASAAASCAIRYVLSDELTRLCAALAFSKGAQTLSCANLCSSRGVFVGRVGLCTLAERIGRYGFPPAEDGFGNYGRRGAMLRASRDGRRGQVRTFWTTGETDQMLSRAPCWPILISTRSAISTPRPLGGDCGLQTAPAMRTPRCEDASSSNSKGPGLTTMHAQTYRPRYAQKSKKIRSARSRSTSRCCWRSFCS